MAAPSPHRGSAVAVLQPHALAEHVPLLLGPLPVTGPGTALEGLLELQPQGGSAASMALAWCAICYLAGSSFHQEIVCWITFRRIAQGCWRCYLRSITGSVGVQSDSSLMFLRAA